jgi:hypothetical protein
MKPLCTALVAAFAAALIFFAAKQVNAEVTYSYVAEKPVYVGAPGSTIAINIYLKETLTNGSTSFIASDGGLRDFGTLVTEVGGPASPSKLSGAFANTSDFPVFSNSPFDFVDSNGDTGQIYGSAAFNPGILVKNTGGGTAPALDDGVFLGHFNVVVGSPGPTTFSLGALDPVYGGSTVTKNDLYDLDVQVDGNFYPTNLFTGVGTSTTTFVVVPEPSSLAVFGAGCLALLVRSRRSRGPS